MTYWQFHVAFLFPALVALLGWQRWRCCPAPPRIWLGIIVAAAIAFLYTTPWDNYLVWRGVWSYRPGRVAAAWRVGYVPLEEYLFFLLQPVLTGLCLWSFGAARFSGGRQGGPTADPWPLRLAGATVAALLGAVGACALAVGGRWLYAGLILAWGAPPLTLHWLYGGDALWDERRVALPAVLLATVYLWIADGVAIDAGVWSISPLHSTGWTVLGLPVEEALFFVITNGLIVQTLVLFWRRVDLFRVARFAHP